MTPRAADRLVAAGRLVVVGDSFLDVDVDGSATRLAPDAPVPVVDTRQTWQRPGGAALAALLAARQHADVVLVTAVATDPAADVLLGLLSPYVTVRPLPLAGDTVCKTRVRAGDVPMLRLDSGTGRAADLAVLPDAAAEAIATADAILVSDYGQGVTSVAALRQALAERAAQVPVVWDPHPRGQPPVPGCSLVTPNAAEARHFGGGADLAEQGPGLCSRWRAEAVAVTVGDRGALLTTTSPTRTVPVPLEPGLVARGPRPDTCGAGDSFAAAAAVALVGGAEVPPAVHEGVLRAARFVRDGAAASVSSAVGAARSAATEARDRQVDAFALAERVRAAGGTVVATGGCFDLLHRGHVALLERARQLGDALIVCLNSDSSVRRAKGPDRPVVAEDDRAAVLSALGSVDAVTVFEEGTPEQLLARLRPDVWVKGGDYAGQPLPEADVVQAAGGRVVLLPFLPGYSTSRVVELLRSDGTRAARPGLSAVAVENAS